jgi:hypothetical protein
MKDKEDKELTDLAVKHGTARDERMVKGREEKTAKSALEVKMDEKGVTHYRDPETGVEAWFEVKRNLKTKIPGQLQPEEGEE